MKTRSIWSGGLFALALVGGAGWWLERATAEHLAGEMAAVRAEHEELARLRAEHQRLLAAQPPPAVLAAWRADHAAVLRLRTEISELKARLQAREQALAK